MARPFRLQSLLEHKRQQEEQQTLLLAALDAQYRDVRQSLDLLRREEDEQMGRIAALARGGRLDAAQYHAAISYLDRLEGSIAEQTDLLQAAEQRVLESRDALIGILKEKRSLERLHEQRDAEAEIEDGRREARQVDEMTSARYIRRAAERAGEEA